MVIIEDIELVTGRIIPVAFYEEDLCGPLEMKMEMNEMIELFEPGEKDENGEPADFNMILVRPRHVVSMRVYYVDDDDDEEFCDECSGPKPIETKKKNMSAVNSIIEKARRGK